MLRWELEEMRACIRRALCMHPSSVTCARTHTDLSHLDTLGRHLRLPGV